MPLTTPYEFQKLGADFHFKTKYSINRCTMGLGKTLQSLMLVEKVGGRTLVLCPAFLKQNWENEILTHLGSDHLKNFVILPYSTLSSKSCGMQAIYTGNFKTIIADECHFLKTEESNRTKKFFSIMEKVKPEYFVGLSGTPIKNRLSELYPLLKAVALNPNPPKTIDTLKYFPTKEKFCDYFCYRKVFKVSRWTEHVSWTGLKPETVKVLRQLLENKVYSVNAEEVIDLPPLRHKKVHTEVPIHMTGDLQLEYENYVLGGKSSVAKKASAILKAKFTCEYVDSLLEQTEDMIVVFTDHVSSCEIIANHFKVTPIHGGTPVEDRMKIASNAVKVIVATIGSFSVGVNLTKANNLVFNDVSWIPADNFQAMKRIHRIGQTKSCLIHYVLAGHVDEFILDMIKTKMEVINSIS